MKIFAACAVWVGLAAGAWGAGVAVDVSGVRPGPITVTAGADTVEVTWEGEGARRWKAVFSLDTRKPLIAAISADGNDVVKGARPLYRCTTGKRNGGWDNFFDAPALAKEGTRSFVMEFHPVKVVATTVGDRVEMTFDGVRIGSFTGSLRYVFYPGTVLIQQVALLSTNDPDTAYFYDAGLQMASPGDVTAGGNMGTDFHYYDALGKLTDVVPPYGSERHSLAVKYRTVAAKMGGGSLAVFPPPHRYLFARDYTTNQGYLWYSAWRGQVGMGVQQFPDDNTGIDPWMNAPPGTVQEMGLFLLPSAEGADANLEHVLAYTHGDRFPHVDGFVTFEPHWHLAYTVQAMQKGLNWVPPFKPIMEAVGIDAALIFDFHLDGHPENLGETRLHELSEYAKACRAQSDAKFLLMPGEEANVILGGHWGLVFPKPVYWVQDRKPGEELKSTVAGYGTVWRVKTPDDVWRMVTEEGGWVYQTHPRTKGSTGYPDAILGTSYFRDARYLGVGWKSMPSDLSKVQLGDRGFKALDDVNNLGLKKHMIGEVDVFQLNPTDELYGLLNLNYLKMAKVPDFDHYGEILESVQRGDGFISTGEVLLPKFALVGDGDVVKVTAEVSSTFPLRAAEIVWGDGKATHREVVDLSVARSFAEKEYAWEAKAPGWTWARVEVWDVAGDGAFTQPEWRK